MARSVREIIDVQHLDTLEALIERLTMIRGMLPRAAEAQVRMRGDDVFGRRLTISYFRPQTAEEASLDARCQQAFREARKRAGRDMPMLGEPDDAKGFVDGERLATGR